MRSRKENLVYTNIIHCTSAYLSFSENHSYFHHIIVPFHILYFVFYIYLFHVLRIVSTLSNDAYLGLPLIPSHFTLLFIFVLQSDLYSFFSREPDHLIYFFYTSHSLKCSVHIIHHSFILESYFLFYHPLKYPIVIAFNILLCLS